MSSKLESTGTIFKDLFSNSFFKEAKGVMES